MQRERSVIITALQNKSGKIRLINGLMFPLLLYLPLGSGQKILSIVLMDMSGITHYAQVGWGGLDFISQVHVFCQVCHCSVTLFNMLPPPMKPISESVLLWALFCHSIWAVSPEIGCNSCNHSDAKNQTEPVSLSLVTTEASPTEINHIYLSAIVVRRITL